MKIFYLPKPPITNKNDEISFNLLDHIPSKAIPMNAKLPLLMTSIATVLLQAVMPVHAESGDTLRKIKEAGVISIGGRDASFPFSYKVDSDSNPIGFSSDLCGKVVEAIKSKLGMPQLKVEYTIVTPVNRIALVQNGTIDLECSTTTNTTARAQQVEFAPNHFVASIAVAVKRNSGINSLAQLDGKGVVSVSGSTSVQLLRSYRKNQKVDFTEIFGKDTSDAFLVLSSGRASAMVLEDVQLAGLIARSGNASDYKILGERLREEPYGIMLRKDDAQFKALVDEAILSVMKSGEINELYAKWFTRPVPPTGINLNFPMSAPLRDAYKRPSNQGI
jgi:glutamate/aspartate transport system substrate-binding protein